MVAEPPGISGGRWVWSKHVARGIGFFGCRCQHGWTSSWADRQFAQQCNRCPRWVKPKQFFVWYTPDHSKTKDKTEEKFKGHHRTAKCEACRAKQCRFRAG